MTHRIALATCELWPDLDVDGPELIAALTAEGLVVELHAWDSEVDWAGFDLVVIRTTWDYWDRHEKFLAWTRSVPRLANSGEIVAWNIDKTYLRRLADAGIPIVPTIWLEPGEAFESPAEPFVIKPSVSAGARDTAAYEGGDRSAQAHVARLHAAGKTVMVQPYMHSVDADGETALLVFDGQFSHAARKSAVLSIGGGEPELGSWSMEPRTPIDAEVEMAMRVVETAQCWGDDLLYARVDLLPGPVLIELEVMEPALFLGFAPGSAQRFAQAVARWAERSGGSTPRS